MTLRSPFFALLLIAGCSGSQQPSQKVQLQCTDASKVRLSTLDNPPPPVSGGTLLATHDGRTAVIADPDRDLITVVDVASFTVRGTIALKPGDEPGRAVEDSAGRVHVALRRGGALVAIDVHAVKLLERRPVCAAPRGIAYQPGRDVVHVACAGGELVTLAATGGRGFQRQLNLEADLRDVIVRGDLLLVSKFRSAELLTIDASGNIVARTSPQHFSAPDVRQSEDFEPAVAWRTIPFQNGVLMAHQRGTNGVINTRPAPAPSPNGITSGGEGPIDLGVPFPPPPPFPPGGPFNPGGPIDPGGGMQGGYGAGGPGGNPCGAISHVAVSVLGNGNDSPGPAFPSQVVLPVDLALHPDGVRLALISASSTDPQNPGALNVFLLDTGSLQLGAFCGAQISEGFNVPQPIAIAFAGDLLLAQSRDPSVLTAFDTSPAVGVGGPTGIRTLALGGTPRADTGHTRFHSNTNGIACASCHPEGGEDGRVWQFDFGPRRTQELRGGVASTAPFHWSGDLPTMMDLVNEIFTRRMGAQAQSCDDIAAMASWVDTIPLVPKAAPASADSVARGRAIFFDPATLCSTCHTPPQYSNNGTFVVGTGEPFQVPRLLGVADRAPYLHDGRAATLRDRFDPTYGGGEQHGHTAHLTSAQIDDLVAFLRTL
ncbi:MAG TPA: c-type cytochrome [Polyangia bacterium]|nr:c-type cytochrome [Polyangia bacterium]